MAARRGNGTRSRSHLPAPRGTARRIGTPTLALLLFLLLLLPLVSGCLAPSMELESGDCPAPLELPKTLPEAPTRMTHGVMELRDTTGVWTPVQDHTRIVATSHDLVELLFLLGHGDRLVAVPDWIDHPAGAHPEGIDGLERLGQPHVIPAEDVRAQDPTLVLDKPHPLQPTPLADSLRGAGIPTIVFDTRETLHSLALTYATIGAVLSPLDPEAPENAQSLWDAFHAELTHMHNTLSHHILTTGAQCPDALYMFPANLAAGAHTSAGLILELAGARNLAAQAGLEGYRTLSREALLARDPERIVGTTTGGLPSPDSPRWAPTKAAAYGREAFHGTDPALTGLTGPRYPEGVRQIAQWLHPAAFELIVPDVTTTKHENPNGTLTLTIEAGTSQAQDGPLTYRLLPGDGAPATETDDGTFTHTYTDPHTITPELLLIDTQGRIHIETIVIQDGRT